MKKKKVKTGLERVLGVGGGYDETKKKICQKVVFRKWCSIFEGISRIVGAQSWGVHTQKKNAIISRETINQKMVEKKMGKGCFFPPFAFVCVFVVSFFSQ